MDVHLAWRAEVAACCGGRVVIGTASLGQLRAAVAASGDCLSGRRGLCRVVGDFGRLLPADGILVGIKSPFAVIDLDGAESADGFRPAMVTVCFAGPDAESFLKRLGRNGGEADDRGDAVFIACLDTGDAGASVLASLADAATVRRAELPRLVRAASDAAAKRALERA